MVTLMLDRKICHKFKILSICVYLEISQVVIELDQQILGEFKREECFAARYLILVRYLDFFRRYWYLKITTQKIEKFVILDMCAY